MNDPSVQSRRDRDAMVQQIIILTFSKRHFKAFHILFQVVTINFALHAIYVIGRGI